MPETPLSRGPPAMAGRSIPINYKERIPVTAPHHGWLTSPARSHSGAGQGTELPLHLIALILNHVRVPSRGCRCDPQADDLIGETGRLTDSIV